MSLKKLLFGILIISLIFISCKSTNKTSEKIQSSDLQTDNRDYMRLMFYNVENLFDTFNDSLKRDDEFLPEGEKHWSNSKYYQKLNNIYKVILGVGGWQAPDIVGLCEVENRYVLDGILRHTPLKKMGYSVAHFESPDKRGIDVAMFYLAKRFQPIFQKAIPINFPNDASKKTRDILYVKGKTYKNDTLHIFINHWPSRWGGQLNSEHKRMFVASVLRNTVDSIFRHEAKPNIIIMGDLNDYPDNKSLTEVLRAKRTFENYQNKELYNLAYYMQETKKLGTHKYAGEWGVLDQIIVTGSLLNKNNTAYCTLDDAHVYKAPFLMEKDEQNTGERTFRTYIGFKFHGGFSDHLPVYLDLHRN